MSKQDPHFPSLLDPDRFLKIGFGPAVFIPGDSSPAGFGLPDPAVPVDLAVK